MKKYGKTSISEFLEDFIVYRNIVPIDKRLPSFRKIAEAHGINSDQVPRKTSKEYARILSYLLKEARLLKVPGGKIERAVLIGDTRMNDGTAFLNICRSADWRGMAFIGSHKSEPEKWQVEDEGNQLIVTSNRWQSLSRFSEETKKQDFVIDENTAVLIDLDKTALGARGRNDRVIDRARVKAAQCVAENILGDQFNFKQFQATYDTLNQPEFHSFTADNQDYLVFICLIISTGMFDMQALVQGIQAGKNSTFTDFIQEVNRRCDELPGNLRLTHQDFYNNWQSGDPTPFKEFRFCEYQNTADLLGVADDDMEIGELLKTEIVITQEVREIALAWRDRGALLFGLSDKPDEASLPTDELAGKGYKPIHQIITHIVGE